MFTCLWAARGTVRSWRHFSHDSLTLEIHKNRARETEDGGIRSACVLPTSRPELQLI